MTKIKLNLPPYRLTVALRITRRRFSWKRAIKASLRRIREIEPREVRRFIHRAFAHKSIKKILGTNLAFALILTSFVPSQEFVGNAEAIEPVVAEAQTVLTTEIATQYPVEKIKITQGYGFFHPGVDLDGLTGDSIRPIKKGRVKEVSYSKYAYGNSIVVEHDQGLVSLYAHLSRIDVEANQDVTTSTVIGKMGASGRAFGDHLHLEIRDHGRSVNPTSILPR